MSYCAKCGKEVLNGSPLCQHCSENLSSAKSDSHAPNISSMLTNDEFATFVGKNSEKYLTKFAKFHIGGVDSFKATWHWPAFFIPFLWMLHRKIYGWAILAFFTALIPYIGILLHIVWAITANYIYYRQTKRKLLEIKQSYPSPEKQRAIIVATGGVGHAAVLIGVLICFLAIIGILVAIAIPQFKTYRERKYNAAAKTDVQGACNEASCQEKSWDKLKANSDKPVSAQATHSWKLITPMPHGRYGHGAALGHDGRIYVMGGWVCDIKNDQIVGKHNDGIYSNLVYDPEAHSWEYLEPVQGWVDSYYRLYNREKKNWESFKFVRQEGELQVFQGTRSFGVDNPKRIEILVDKVAELRNTGFTRHGNGVSVVAAKDGKIWWIGGMAEWSGCGENVVLPYDPTTGQWPKATSVFLLPRVFSEKKSEGYDPAWAMAEAGKEKVNWGFRYTIYQTDIPPMHERRIDAQAVVTPDGKIYVMGGYRMWKEPHPDHTRTLRTAVSDTMECYDPETNTWQYKKSLSSPRMVFAAAVGPDGKIYVFGGAKGMGDDPKTPVLNTTEVYDPKTDTWSIRKPMPEALQGDAAVLAADGKIYVIGGGKTAFSPPLADVFIYDPVNDSWQRGPSMNVPRAALAAVATSDGRIYAIGGTDRGAYPKREAFNDLLGHLFYAGIVQNTVEVLDVPK